MCNLYFFLFAAQQPNSGLDLLIFEVSSSYKIRNMYSQYDPSERVISLLQNFHSGDQIKKNGMGWARDNMEDGKSAWSVWWGDLRELKHLEGIDVDEKMC